MVSLIAIILAVLSVTEGIVGKERFLKKYFEENESIYNEQQLQEMLTNLFSCCDNHSYRNGIDINITKTKKVKTLVDEMYNFWRREDKKFNSSLLHYSCPVILNELDICSCRTNDIEAGVNATVAKRPSAFETWVFGFAFVTIINLFSLLGAVFIPTTDKEFCKQVMMVMMGMAVGSLSASSVFHLIPQAFHLVATDAHNGYLNVSLTIWLGIWAFFVLERILSLVKHVLESKKLHREDPLRSTSAEAVSNLSSPTELSSGHGDFSRAEPGNLQLSTPQDPNYEIPHDSPHHDHANFETGKTVVWMIIFGDGFHNFIDGLSIGAAFSQSILTGISISVAVICEELPHELGDFAVLRNAGLGLKKAMLYNFLSAITCYFGLIFGIILGEFDTNSYIFGFAAGIFLYISLVDMMPELNEVASNAKKVGVKRFLKVFFLQNLGILLGATTLYLFALYPDSIRFN